MQGDRKSALHTDALLIEMMPHRAGKFRWNDAIGIIRMNKERKQKSMRNFLLVYFRIVTSSTSSFVMYMHPFPLFKFLVS